MFKPILQVILCNHYCLFHSIIIWFLCSIIKQMQLSPIDSPVISRRFYMTRDPIVYMYLVVGFNVGMSQLAPRVAHLLSLHRRRHHDNILLFCERQGFLVLLHQIAAVAAPRLRPRLADDMHRSCTLTLRQSVTRSPARGGLARWRISVLCIKLAMQCRPKQAPRDQTRHWLEVSKQ